MNPLSQTDPTHVTVPGHYTPHVGGKQSRILLLLLGGCIDGQELQTNEQLMGSDIYIV